VAPYEPGEPASAYRRIVHWWTGYRRVGPVQEVGTVPGGPGSVPPAEPAEPVRAHGADAWSGGRLLRDRGWR